MRLESDLPQQKLLDLLREAFEGFSRCCLTTTDNSILYMNVENLSDVGTLSQCCEVANRYLQLQDKDIVLTNDPYSGGSNLSSPTLILGVAPKGGKSEFLIASRLTLMPHMGPHKTVDEEGLRIPPTPVVMGGQINSAIFEALKAHPMATPYLIASLENEITRLLALRDHFVSLIERGYLDLGKVAVKTYLKASAARMRARLDDLPFGEVVVEDEIGPRETLKLRFELSEGSVTFDFSGTSAGVRNFITDSATYGASVAAFLSRFHENIPINSGVLSHFHIIAPRGSLVNASFPRPIQLGHTDGLNAVAGTVLEAISRIDKKYPVARSGLTYLMVEMDFGNGKKFLDALGFGMGGSYYGPGQSGMYFWRRFKHFASIEELEKSLPIEIVSSSLRTNSGGDGLKKGGDGAAKSVKVLADCELRWQHLTPTRKPEGIHGGKSGLPAEMILQKANGEQTTLGDEGIVKMQPGDVLISLAPGGGGFGAPPITP